MSRVSFEDSAGSTAFQCSIARIVQFFHTVKRHIIDSQLSSVKIIENSFDGADYLKVTLVTIEVHTDRFIALYANIMFTIENKLRILNSLDSLQS